MLKVYTLLQLAKLIEDTPGGDLVWDQLQGRAAEIAEYRHLHGAMSARCYFLGDLVAAGNAYVKEHQSPNGQIAASLVGLVARLEDMHIPAPALVLPAGTLTPEEVVTAARNVNVDLTCGACTAISYTGYFAAPMHPPAHDPFCKTLGLPAGVEIPSEDE